MNLQQRLGILIDQPADAAGLRAAEILRDDAAGREDHRIFGVGHLAGIAVAHGIEMRLAVRRLEFAVFPEPRGARMIEAGTRPEDAHVLLDLLVRDAEVIGGAAFRGDAQLVENVFGSAK